MARPPDPERRRELAHRCVEVLEREGIALSMTALAEALHVKRPTLLYHFPTKAHILEAELLSLLTEQAGFVLAEVERHEHPIDRLFAQLRAVHAFHSGREARLVFLTQAIAATAGSDLPALVETGARILEAHRRDTVARLRAGMANGAVAPCDPEALVACMRALTEGLILQLVTHQGSLDAAQRFVWEHLLQPLRRDPGVVSEAQRPKRSRT